MILVNHRFLEISVTPVTHQRDKTWKASTPNRLSRFGHDGLNHWRARLTASSMSFIASSSVDGSLRSERGGSGIALGVLGLRFLGFIVVDHGARVGIAPCGFPATLPATFPSRRRYRRWTAASREDALVDPMAWPCRELFGMVGMRTLQRRRGGYGIFYVPFTCRLLCTPCEILQNMLSAAL